MITAPGLLIREAREAAGLTQAELARRVGTSQSVIARLERSSSNPRMDTLNRAIAATGHALEVSLSPSAFPQVDETITASNLRRSPAERLRRFAGAYNELRKLAPTVRNRSGS